jgi:hypothetical protein
MPQGDKVSSAVTALLIAAEEVGVASLIRTTLHKFVYLLDVYEAEFAGGVPFTGVNWQFLHYGPFSAEVASGIDMLAASGGLIAETRTRADDDTEFVSYTLNRRGPSLADLGVSGYSRLRLNSDIQRFSKDLSALLNYVYFRTEPMSDAVPGQNLSFAECRRRATSDYRHVQMKKLEPKKLTAAREALAKLSAKQKSTVAVGQYDEIYARGLAELCGKIESPSFRGVARISLT